MDLNAEQSNIWPNITRKGTPPPDGEKFDGEEGKYDKYFSKNPGNTD